MRIVAARTATNGSETRRKGSGVSFESHEDTIGMVGLLHDQVSWKLVKRAEDRLTFRMADLRINEFAGWACERDWMGRMEIFQCTTGIYLQEWVSLVI